MFGGRPRPNSGCKPRGWSNLQPSHSKVKRGRWSDMATAAPAVILVCGFEWGLGGMPVCLRVDCVRGQCGSRKCVPHACWVWPISLTNARQSQIAETQQQQKQGCDLADTTWKTTHYTILDDKVSETVIKGRLRRQTYQENQRSTQPEVSKPALPKETMRDRYRLDFPYNVRTGFRSFMRNLHP